MRRDFECVLSAEDYTGARPFSGALDLVVRRLNIVDAWTNTSGRNTFTPY